MLAYGRGLATSALSCLVERTFCKPRKRVGMLEAVRKFKAHSVLGGWLQTFQVDPSLF